MQLSPEKLQKKSSGLTDKQLQEYDARGFLVLPDLLAERDMQPVQDALNQKVSMIADDLLAHGLITDKLEHRPFKYRLAELFGGLSDKDFLSFGRSWRDRIPGYHTLMANPKILDAAEGLIGPEIFASPIYNVRPKVPKVAAGAVPWHQDKSYWPDANANPVITVWISLVDATLDNGCLHIIPGTHKARVVRHRAEVYSGTGYEEVDDEMVARASKRAPVASLPVKAGTAILFNDRVLHMSTPNNSDHVRWSVDLRYQPTDQDPMPQHGAGFLARSLRYPERVATLQDWLAERPEHKPEA